MSDQMHCYSGLQQRIHEDLRIEHPEWARCKLRANTHCQQIATSGASRQTKIQPKQDAARQGTLSPIRRGRGADGLNRTNENRISGIYLFTFPRMNGLFSIFLEFLRLIAMAKIES